MAGAESEVAGAESEVAGADEPGNTRQQHTTHAQRGDNSTGQVRPVTEQTKRDRPIADRSRADKHKDTDTYRC